MEIRQASNPEDVKRLNTSELRERFLIENLFEPEQINMVYSHHDRMIVGGAYPIHQLLELTAENDLRTDYFLERREIGMVNIGGVAIIEVDGESYELLKLDALYVGKGKRKVLISSKDPINPAKVYFTSSLAHTTYPTTKIELEKATPNHLGAKETCNKRTIYQYIHEGNVQSCQLMLGVTLLDEGSIWNTMPAHTHDRRMEAYLYFNMNEDTRVFHFMGEPNETRHLVVKNEQAVISPNWSIHSGAGTSSYSFIWAMAGENYTFKDMDIVKMDQLQ